MIYKIINQRMTFPKYLFKTLTERQFKLYLKAFIQKTFIDMSLPFEIHIEKEDAKEASLIYNRIKLDEPTEVDSNSQISLDVKALIYAYNVLDADFGRREDDETISS